MAEMSLDIKSNITQIETPGIRAKVFVIIRRALSGKPKDTKPQNITAANPNYKEAVKAWNSVDRHPADKPLIDTISKMDSRESANKRASLLAKEPTLHPILGTTNNYEQPMANDAANQTQVAA
jgi:hypothetical protein